LIEAVMLVALGFLSASLMGLAALPALARRADRLARKRAEAAFPLSLAEIAADRDHLRAELAMQARALEQKAESGFAAKAGAMGEIGRRDMSIGRLERELGERDARIAGLEDDLSATRTDLADTRDALTRETAAHAGTATALEGRISDLAALERNLAEVRSALSGTGSDLDARTNELSETRNTLGRVESVLAEREKELAQLRREHDGLKVAQVEARTQILVLESKRDELSGKLAARERAFDETSAALKAMIVDRDSERLRADALNARAAEAEAGLAAASARSNETGAEIVRLEAAIKQQDKARGVEEQGRLALAAELTQTKSALEAERQRLKEEAAQMHEDLREREGRLETVHAEVQTLKGALAQVRADLARSKRELSQLRKQGRSAGEPGSQNDNAALRQEIVKLAERLMTLPPKQEAAE
jgi:chromosome segregation ATPase